MLEDKQKICALLLPALQATSNLYDLTDLKYDAETETVTAVFVSGFAKTANVALDSGTAMIKDIVTQIV